MRYRAPVIRGQHKIIVVLVCVMFVLALGGCLFFCVDAGGGCQSDQTASCSCLCQVSGLVPVTTAAVSPSDVTAKFVPVPHHVNFREVAAAIFNPPKV